MAFVHYVLGYGMLPFVKMISLAMGPTQIYLCASTSLSFICTILDKLSQLRIKYSRSQRFINLKYLTLLALYAQVLRMF